MTESFVRIDPQVERLTEGVHGIPPVAFIFRPAPGTDASRDAVSGVLDQTFAAMGWQDGREDPPWVAYPRIEVAPGGHLLVFEYVEDHQAYRAFLSALVIHMERAGLSGALLPPPGVRLPIRVPYAPAECLTAGLALNIDFDKVKALPQAAANIGWHVSPALTTQVIDMVSVVGRRPGREVVLLQRQPCAQNSRPGARAHRSHLLGRPATALTAATPHEFRRVQFSVFGHVTFEIGSVDDDWSADLANLVDLLIAGAADTRYGFLRRSVAPQRHWFNALWTYPPPPPSFMPQSYYRSPSDVESSYVPDVYGVQLLNRSHMANLTDLSQWQTQELSSGRFLVSSPNPEDWFRAGAPGQEVLPAARRDFQSVIMTREIVDRQAT